MQRVERRIWAGVVAANTAGALLIFPGAYYFVPVYFKTVAVGRLLRLGALVGIPYLISGAIMGRYLLVPRKHRPAVRWIAEEREPTEDERRRLATQPRRQANSLLPYWIFLPFWGIPYIEHNGGVHMDTIVRLKFVNGLVFLGFVSWTLSYLFVERAIRPLLALAMSGAPPSEPRTMGVYPRLLVAWTASAGLPLWAIVVSLLGLNDVDRARAIPYVFVTCFSAGVAGIIATTVAARAITDPLEKVRSGMRSVERGEIDVEIPVDEASEIGVLQMGFNRMAHGLRERERMREIFGRHVGPDVAQRAMETDSALGGELVEATAMFVDMIGSSSLAEQRPPDEVVAVLNSYFDAVVRCVGAEGGYVSKFEGDGALCVFGAPIEVSDHAVRALRAARTLRAELRTLAEGVDAAIGISSGQVVAGNVGAANRYEYTIIGDPVNEASRLTDEAKYRHTRILASERTLERSGAEVEHWTHSGTIPLRGRSRPTVAYEPASS